ncbi:MAG: benzoate-CoA ligase family protein [Alphaproteobacteria bacterium]|nr:benzoate-CoA ligase family protein [Alphaproteobacteria bacterium]
MGAVNSNAGENYNAAADLIGRNLDAGRSGKTAFIDSTGHHSYAEVAARAARFANSLARLGIEAESRVALVMLDSIDLVACFLGAIKAGVVPVPLNTRLASRDYAYILGDSRAAAVVVSESLVETVLAEAKAPDVILVDGADGSGHALLSDAIKGASDRHETALTTADDMCFWLYTSGTTGAPKGAVHLHGHLMATAELYAIEVLGMVEDDIVYSAAKIFFAYGLGNSLTFPMAVGATTVLLPGPPDPASVSNILKNAKPTLFFGVPTLYAMLLAGDQLPGADGHSLRLCISAGEPLPADLLRRWRELVGVDILDGIGTTEMLHIFVSNRIGEVTPGATGRPVPGYEVRLINEDGMICGPGEMGVLEISGPTSALMYWNQREKTKDTFRGPWTRTGDNFVMDEGGILTYGGRNDDMLKVGGIYVSPFEVEGALIKHESVMEAAVVGRADQDELIKPKAFVVLNAGVAASAALEQSLKDFVRADLATFKYPRWIEFMDELPKTATGKIQRFRLRVDQ